MEELKKLEEAQVVLELLLSRSVVTASSDPGADRFLANLVLLLIQPCADLDLNTKRRLVNENMPQISSALLEEASILLGQKDSVKLEKAGPNCSNWTTLAGSAPVISFHDKVDQDFLQSELGNEAVIGLDSMQRANSTLEDFCRSYFMFHGMDVNRPQSVFKYLPMLFFVESYIYQLDTLNEKVVNIYIDGKTMAPSQSEITENGDTGGVIYKFQTDPFRPLLLLLECHGLLTERIKEELRSGAEYWALERKLCFALKSRQEVSAEDVMRAIHLKSFDYRVLNLLLYQLRGEEVNDLHMDFLSTSEFLVEVSDDLFDYEEDVLENSFNILRMFVRIYGASAAPAMLAKCIAEAEEKYDQLLHALGPQLSSQYQRRCEEATAEGGKTGAHPFGTWSMPTVIVDEELYRANVLNCE
ncbi:uncharacterized protein LOC116198631 [Punica granatum]|uniref:Uncharacterized protein LOC116198631 n=1 Tax=Punica granatum TaxID=22663 RepID=A0A218VZC7_PUNGR|nr:uncharacterized protein LOC116198631 [Punica granatum]OWM65643.1 hypothetical protein CDL15_Pgr017140 [Punica granatum]